MADKTLPGNTAAKDEPIRVADFAEPLYDLAALLRLAQETVTNLEDQTPGASDSFHALQRTLAMCMREAERMALVALEDRVIHG